MWWTLLQYKLNKIYGIQNRSPPRAAPRYLLVHARYTQWAAAKGIMFRPVHLVIVLNLDFPSSLCLVQMKEP